MTSLSGLAVSLGVASGPPIVRARLELFLPHPKKIGVALFGAKVLVGVLVTGGAPASGAVHIVLLVGTGGDNDGSSG